MSSSLRSLPLLTAALTLAPLALTGCHDEEEPLAPPSIAWQECEGASLFECGTLVVPRDHDDPYDGFTFDVPVLRAPATDPAHRIGSLVVNPGGPGGSGVSLAKFAAFIMPTAIRERFDVVGFDPRGEAASTPTIDCVDDLSRFAALDTTPDDATEREALITESRALAGACDERSGDLLRYVGTDSIVRDMDLLREALGDEGLTYLGFSYGTFLGAIYADTFPDHVRALVLDGALDPTLTNEAMIEGQAIGFEGELTRFFAWCSADPECPILIGGSAGADPIAVYDAVHAAVETAPLPVTGSDRTVGPGEFSYGVSAALYQRGNWPALANALAQANEGDGIGLAYLGDDYLERDKDGHYGNGIEVYYAVTSIDTTSSRDPEVYAALAAKVADKAPRIGAYLPYSALPSAFWPVPSWRAAAPVHAVGSPPIVVVGSTLDPATPLAWSVALAKQLPQGKLLVREGDGHTSFLRGNPCIDDAVTDYFVNLHAPPPETVCPE